MTNRLQILTPESKVAPGRFHCDCGAGQLSMVIHEFLKLLLLRYFEQEKATDDVKQMPAELM